MWREGEIHDVVARALQFHRDARGWLTELYRHDELPAELHPQMAYLSLTEPGACRGPHEHRDQADFFAFTGPGELEIWLWDPRPHSPSEGVRQVMTAGASAPMTLLVPAGVVHAYRCVSDAPGWVLNAPNRLYAGRERAEAVDEIRHEDNPDSPFRLER